MEEIKTGDRVKIEDTSCGSNGKEATIKGVSNGMAYTDLCMSYHPIKSFRKINTMGETKMELKEIKKSNLIEAAKQFNEEKKNAEIEYAKQKYREAVDKINEIERQIKQLEESKKQYTETTKIFV